MEILHRKKIIEYYSALVKKHGHSPQSVGWGSRKGKQGLRFSVLCEIGNISNCSILDVGCGFGDLYGYLDYKKIKTDYYGIDINPHLLELGQKIYPKANLELRDFEEEKFTRKFDWVFASGITSVKGSYPQIKKIMIEMFRICKNGYAMNFVGGVKIGRAHV